MSFTLEDSRSGSTHRQGARVCKYRNKWLFRLAPSIYTYELTLSSLTGVGSIAVNVTDVTMWWQNVHYFTDLPEWLARLANCRTLSPSRPYLGINIHLLRPNRIVEHHALPYCIESCDSLQGTVATIYKVQPMLLSTAVLK